MKPPEPTWSTACMTGVYDGWIPPESRVKETRLRTCRKCGGSVYTREGKVEYCVKIGMAAVREMCCPHRPIRTLKAVK